MNETKLREGYKKTDIGIIPENWDLLFLDELTNKIGDGIHSTPKYSSDGEFFFINGNNLGDGNILISKETKRVSKEDFLIHKRSLSNTTILLSINGTIGSVAYYKNEKIILGKSVAYINLNNKIKKELFYFLLQTQYIRNYFNDKLTGSTIKNLGLGTIRRTPIPLPPTLGEQRAIATALSDADELIAELDKLITKKQNIKQATMQQLLTPPNAGQAGKKRLPGFSGDWEVKELGDVADVVGGGTPSTTINRYWNGDINWFTPTEIGITKYINQSRRRISKEGYLSCSANMLPKGTILLTTRAGIGNVCILLKQGCTNQGFQSLIAKDEYDNEYLYYLTKTLKNIFNKNASGSTFLEISPNKIKQVEVNIPEYDEQKAIAKVLADIDSEIEALEQKRDKYKAIKEGMMQELLTGKIRIMNYEL